jgi:GNAT superfamily N-acetyltransferase
VTLEIVPLAAADEAEIERFFPQVGVSVPPANLRQFGLPRRSAPGVEVGALALYDSGRMVGLLGYLDLPLRVGGAITTGRWPLNFFLLAPYRGRGLGRRLMEATREGVRWRLVIGGNANSTPVLAKTGWLRIGRLTTCAWPGAALAPALQLDRLRRDRRPPPAVVRWRGEDGPVAARRCAPADLPAPGAARENGVPRDPAYLDFAFGGALAPYHLLYGVEVAGEPAGHFVLAARAGRRLTLEVHAIDLDAAPGREAAVIAAARRVGRRAGDEVRFHTSSARFLDAARRLPGRRRESENLPIWLHCADGLAADSRDPGRWHLTHGDHDRYRIFPASRLWG